MLEQRIRELLVSARNEARSGGINAEFMYHRERSSLIRLGNSSVALSTAEELSRLYVDVQDGRKVGSFSLVADIVSAEQLREAVGHAAENCRSALPKDYEPIFGEVEEPVDDSTGFDPELENLSPEAKTELCAKVIKTLGPEGKYDFSGSWSTGASETWVATTANDNEAYRRLTDGSLVLVLKEQDRKWELSVTRTQKKAGEFDADGIIDQLRALLPVYEKHEGFSTELGRQRVLFGPQAIAELVVLAVWGGFIGRMYEEKRAYTAGKSIGDSLFSDKVTIADDPEHPDVFGMPFDLRGKRRKRFVLSDKGLLSNLTYDSLAAAKYGKPPTGHDLGNDDFVLETGSGEPGLEAARKLAGDALYIPHLHYIHMPDPTKGLFTGSSRFNAMRIENGEFTAPMFSTRVTDTSPSVLSNVVELSSKSVSVNNSSTYGRRAPMAISVPEYLLCDNVRITDVADSF